jgi:hypothetical protein
MSRRLCIDEIGKMRPLQIQREVSDRFTKAICRQEQLRVGRTHIYGTGSGLAQIGNSAVTT